MSSQQQDHQNTAQEVKKRKRGDSKHDKQTTRYQCYCEKIYLSYPALYLHLKNKHPQCFMNNRKIEATKFKESTSHEGYKILKMQKQANEANKFQQNYNLQNSFIPKPISNYPFPNFNPFQYSTPPNFMMPPLQSKPYFMENPMPQNMPMNEQIPHFLRPQSEEKKITKQTKSSDQKSQKQLKKNIIKIFNLYISQTANNLQFEKKEILEFQILFSLLAKCIGQKSQKIKNLYNLNGDPLKNQNFKYLEIMVPYFKEKYMPKLLQTSEEKNSQNFTKQQRLIKQMSKNDKSFLNPQNLIKQIQKFQKWLINQQYIKNFEINEEL